MTYNVFGGKLILAQAQPERKDSITSSDRMESGYSVKKRLFQGEGCPNFMNWYILWLFRCF